MCSVLSHHFFVADTIPEELGLFAVLSIKTIVKCPAHSGLYPDIQKTYRQKLLKILTEIF
jgi:hypothetical protein